MANVYDHNGLNGHLVLDSLVTGNYPLGGVSQEMVGTMVLHIVVTSGTISIVIKGRSNTKHARRNFDEATFLPIPYTRRNVAGSVSDDTTVSAAITASGIFKVDASGLDISLEITQTSGVGVVYWGPLEGAAA